MATDTGFGKVKLFDDFLGPAVDETNDWTPVTDGGTSAITILVDGAVLFATGTTDGYREGFTQALNWRASDGGPLIGEFRIKNVTAVTHRALFIGFTDLVSVENPIERDADTYASNAADAVGFMYDTDATNDTWYLCGVANDVDGTAVNTGIVPVADEYQTLRVVVNITGDADFFIDGVYVGTVEDAVTASTALTPIMLIEQRSDTTNRYLKVDYVYLEKGRASA